jgi:hypothetical protein
MSRLDTKAARLEAQSARIQYLIGQGYTREDYKQLIILTNNWKREDGQGAERFYFAVFKGTAAMEMEHKYCASAEHRDRVIQKYKENHDRHADWKAEQKEKNKGKASSHAAASAAIKEELTKAFPGIKFSCKSESFSMGDAARIEWTDGPSPKDVEAITGKYQAGHFDGMTDMYEYSNRDSNLPQVKYVTERRNITEEFKKLVTDQLVELMGDTSAHHYEERPEGIAYQLFSATSLPAGAIVTGVERSGITCGRLVEFYKIVFTAPESSAPQQNKKEDSATAGPVETEAGEVKIIDYSERAIAVLGDTKPIKDKLKELGGKFNFRLSCGAGWIFPKTKQAEVIAALSNNNAEAKEEATTQEEEKQDPEPAKFVHDGLNEEIQKTIEFFKETDIAIHGEVSEGVKEIERKYEQPKPEIYKSLEDIEAAANSGKIISLCNLFDLVNQKKPGSAAI